MSDTGDMLASISFALEYEGHGRARASISDDAVIYHMRPSYAMGDPLFVLLQAVVELLSNGDEATGCEWWYEPALDRWALRREGASVRVTIRHMRYGIPSLDVWSLSKFWLSEQGELVFDGTGDLWKFAAQVRRAVNRLRAAEGDDPTWPRRTAKYRALCDLLDERKRLHQGRQYRA